MVNDTRATIINEKLLLPKTWASDSKRCDRAKIPEQNRTYKTKPELALDMIDEDVARGIKFDWIGGDGLYGHNSQLTKGLDDRNLFYVLDVHKDELIFLENPKIIRPEKIYKKGRVPKKLKAIGEQYRLDKYLDKLDDSDWTKEHVRKTIIRLE